MKALENDFRVMQTKLMPIAWFNPRVAEWRHTSVPTNRKRLRANPQSARTSGARKRPLLRTKQLGRCTGFAALNLQLVDSGGFASSISPALGRCPKPTIEGVSEARRLCVAEKLSQLGNAHRGLLQVVVR
ncbi:hypothetical protein D3C81_1714030 [compost metagenome]